MEQSSNLNLFLYVIVGFTALLFLFRAALSYPRYKKSIYPHLYDNYLIDYYYKLNVFQDASKSAKLKKLIGYHRIVYASIADKQGKLAAQIVTIIHAKGILSIAHLNTSGSISGNDSGNWTIRRSEEGQEKKYKIENPAIYLREYISHLSQVLEDRRVQSAIALNDECDTSNIHSNFKIVKYSELDELIKQADCSYGLNDTEIDEIFTKLGGKIDRK